MDVAETLPQQLRFCKHPTPAPQAIYLWWVLFVLGHPALSSNKKSHRRGGFCYWWRRRESNPRPQVLRLWLYMLILSINLVDGYPTGRENQRRAWISFNE